MNCSKKDCSRKGEWSVEIKIPAKGYAIESHQPLGIMVSIPLCKDHAAKSDILELLPDLKEKLDATFEGSGLAQPDYERAWTVPIRRNSSRFLEFERSCIKLQN